MDTESHSDDLTDRDGLTNDHFIGNNFQNSQWNSIGTPNGV